jgi:hypothetical protein
LKTDEQKIKQSMTIKQAENKSNNICQAEVSASVGSECGEIA